MFKLVFLVTMTFTQTSGEITELGGAGFTKTKCEYVKDVMYDKFANMPEVTEIVELNCVPVE